MRRVIILAVVVSSFVLVTLAASAATSARQDELSAVRSANARFHSIKQAEKAGYEPFYECTEEPGVGTMGQHYVKGALVGDPAVEPLHPEALVYEPKKNGGYRLVAVEYVVLAPTLPAGAPTPTVFGQPMTFVPGAPNSSNRYGLPDFYQRHAWLYERNPLGTFNDCNPAVTCRGNGDGGG
jgi:hypothetical protein